MEAHVVEGRSPTESQPSPATLVPRRGADRRRRPTPAVSRFTFVGGRRRGGRRAGETENTFVDVHGGGLFVALMAALMLNLADAGFTMHFLARGGTEANPIVDQVIQLGVLPFVLLKTVGVGACLLVLCAAKNFRAARIGLGVVIAGYAALLGWHLFLLTCVVE